MLKKTITYTDYDGNERTEDFYFNLTKAECLEMELGSNGGMKKYVERIIAAQDGKQLVSLFKEIIDKSYGVKSLDGKRFVKNQEVLDEFKQSEAYSELFMELATSSDSAAAFVNGVLPVIPENMKESAPAVVDSQ